MSQRTRFNSSTENEDVPQELLSDLLALSEHDSSDTQKIQELVELLQQDKLAYDPKVAMYSLHIVVGKTDFPTCAKYDKILCGKKRRTHLRQDFNYPVEQQYLNVLLPGEEEKVHRRAKNVGVLTFLLDYWFFAKNWIF